MLKILHIEDDLEIAELLKLFFAQRLEMIHHSELEQSIQSLKSESIDLVLLDINLSAHDGLSLCAELHQNFQLPILIATDRDDIESKIKAFENGANDFISKPFDPRELEIRINLLCGKSIAKAKIIFDERAHSLRIDNRPITLTLSEFEIFSILYTNRGKTISRYDIANALDDQHHVDTSMDTLNVLVGRLRKKIDKYSNSNSFIKTARGIGYYFEE